jgi:putative component of toxin-antitoxin plasmid stabilization module
VPEDHAKIFSWELYETAGGRKLVREEIHAKLRDKAARVALAQLMWRIEHGRALPRDTRPLGRRLLEARLTDQSNEYRLYYAHVGQNAVLLGLLFHRKGGQGAQQRAVAKARERLAEWQGRDIR